MCRKDAVSKISSLKERKFHTVVVVSIFGGREEGVFLASLRSLGHYSCNNIATSLHTFVEKKGSIVVSVPGWNE